MKQTMDLNKMSLIPMTEIELQEVNAGGWILGAIVGVVGLVATVGTGGALGELAVGATVAAFAK